MSPEMDAKGHKPILAVPDAEFRERSSRGQRNNSGEDGARDGDMPELQGVGLSVSEHQEHSPPMDGNKTHDVFHQLSSVRKDYRHTFHPSIRGEVPSCFRAVQQLIEALGGVGMQFRRVHVFPPSRAALPKLTDHVRYCIILCRCVSPGVACGAR